MTGVWLSDDNASTWKLTTSKRGPLLFLTEEQEKDESQSICPEPVVEMRRDEVADTKALLGSAGGLQ